jgi:sugar lactone lactonase YvrE
MLGSQQKLTVAMDRLAFPDGAFWSRRDDCLYFVEWSANRIWRLRGRLAEMLCELGYDDGPSGVGQGQDGTLWVCLYSARRLVCLDASGRILQVFSGSEGQPFRGPNDLVVDSHGGLYMTDSGDFEEDWISGRPAGSVYHIDAGGLVRRVATGICYANGIALCRQGSTLVVGEHRRNRLLSYAVEPDGSLSEPQVLARLGAECLLEPSRHWELGPDGIACADGDRMWVAHYGSGKVVCVTVAGQTLGDIRLPRGRKPTNVALDPQRRLLYITEAEEGLIYCAALDPSQE